MAYVLERWRRAGPDSRDHLARGFEVAFREMHALGDELQPETMAAIAARYGVEVDFDRTLPIIERHGLTF